VGGDHILDVRGTPQRYHTDICMCVCARVHVCVCVCVCVMRARGVETRRETGPGWGDGGGQRKRRTGLELGGPKGRGGREWERRAAREEKSRRERDLSESDHPPHVSLSLPFIVRSTFFAPASPRARLSSSPNCLVPSLRVDLLERQCSLAL
jgi:hypothetical protein